MLKLVDVTGNTLMTMSTQLSAECTHNMVEEGAKRLSPSSFEISFPAIPYIQFMLTRVIFIVSKHATATPP